MSGRNTAAGWQERADRYADELVAAGAITDLRWRAVFARTPRHVFVPSFWALDAHHQPDREIVGTDVAQRDEWLDAVYSDQMLVTQWRAGTWAGRPVRLATSSASQPSVVAVMLHRLAVAPDHSVLEIGTGTGYNAALLAGLVGAENVTSIDIDPLLVDQARARLDLVDAGRVRLHLGDGAAPVPGGQGFDRIVATCSVRRIPSAWIRQLRPGGRIVAPLDVGGALLVLNKTTDDTVEGRVDAEEIRFMPLRPTADQPMLAHTAPEPGPSDPADAHHGLTEVDPRVLDDDAFRLWLSLHHPTLQHTWSATGAPRTVYTGAEQAVVGADPVLPALFPVRQYRGRPWDTVEAAWRAFQRAERPRRTRLGVAAREDGTQYVWLDEPRSPYRWPLPAP